MADSAQNPATPFENLRLFHDAARALTSSLDLPTILRSILEQMERFFHPESWSLLMVDDEKRDLYYALARGVSDEALQNIRIPLGTGMAGWVALHGEPLIVTHEGVAARLSNGEQQHSAICLPLRSRERTLGILQVTHPTPQTLTDDAITFLYIVCDYAAIAIENARAVERIQELTITDDCTHLFNARHLAAVLPTEIERARRFDQPLGIVFLDLDYFKQVNDVHGHPAGSRVLAEAAEVITRTLRTVDLAFRYGGDEFVAILPQTPGPAAAAAANRLLVAIRARRFLSLEGLALHLTASLGVASYPEDADNAAALLERADQRMYSVKNTTRDGVATED
ncbi:MAG TPA: sensor domain-containing diguanylate cyclase [Acidobacteriaceae bacterium]|jgi:diguanylate cyclase (GGDEF)-like protein|nr:sensor domain-containing diguanylate cyclase [Acidobacteriaceae bacterium]